MRRFAAFLLLAASVPAAGPAARPIQFTDQAPTGGALVQTVLVQDEALRRADARIRELSGGAEEPASGGFLDTMRQALSGRSANTSVPSVSTTRDQDPRWNSGGALPNASAGPAQGAGFGGGSFLGTAAASAAGVIGGALLLNTISSMFGHHGTSAFAATPSGGSPWDNSASGSDIARDAGLNDIGRGSQSDSRPAGLLDSDNTDDSADLVDDFDGDISGDFGGDFGGDDA